MIVLTAGRSAIKVVQTPLTTCGIPQNLQVLELKAKTEAPMSRWSAVQRMFRRLDRTSKAHLADDF